MSTDGEQQRVQTRAQPTDSSDMTTIPNKDGDPHRKISSRLIHSKVKSSRWWNVLKIIAAIGVCIGVLLCWTEILRDRLIPKRWGVVERGKIYRSGQLSSALVKRVLEQHKIQIIIDLNGSDPNWTDQVAEKNAAELLGIEHTHYKLNGDGTGEILNYAKAIRAIVTAKQENKPVLVHCAAGAQRTGGVIAAYRVLVENVSPPEARAEMMRYGWDPVSDKKLTDFLNRNMAALAKLLVEMGVLSEVPDHIPQMS